MWVVRVYSTEDDELITEHHLRGVTQPQLARALGFMPSAFASTPLDRAALQNLDAAFPGRLGDASWNGGQEFFLDDDTETLPPAPASRARAATAARG
jgi:hypothetical protein